MKAIVLILVASVLLTGDKAMAVDGLITTKSSYGPDETIARVQAQMKAKGLTMFADIDHAAGAAAVGLPLRPTRLLIFGNAKGGTPLMQSDQAVGIDLPLKVLVWQDADGTTWLSYNDPKWIAHRHDIGQTAGPAIEGMSAALRAIATAAAAP